MVQRECEGCEGGGDNTVKCVADSNGDSVADVAKLWSSSISSAMSSGIASAGRSL